MSKAKLASCLTQLAQAATPAEVSTAAAAAEAQLERVHAGPGSTEAAWALDVVRGVNGLQPAVSEDAAVQAQLQRLATHALHYACKCRQQLSAKHGNDTNVLCYAHIRRLLGHQDYKEAVALGWQLHAALAPLVDLDCSTCKAPDMYIGCVLSLVIGIADHAQHSASDTSCGQRSVVAGEQLQALHDPVRRLLSILR